MTYSRVFEVVFHVVETDKPCLHGLPIVISHAHVMPVSLVFLWSITYFTVCNLQNSTHFQLRYLMQACSQATIISKDQFSNNCFKGNIHPITPCLEGLLKHDFMICKSAVVTYTWSFSENSEKIFKKQFYHGNITWSLQLCKQE